MGYRRLLLTRWTRRDALAVLVVIVTVAFLTGVTLVVLAAGTQTTSIAKEYDAGGHATYYDSVEAARTHADGDALVLPVASVTKPDGTSTFVVGVSCRQAEKFRKGSQYSVPCPPDSGVSSGRVASKTTQHVEGTKGGETVRVHPRHSENAILPPYWYVAHESVVSDLGRTGAFVVERSGSGGASGAVSGSVPLRSALPFFLAGIRQVLTVLAITAAGTSVLVGITVYGVTRMHTEDRRRAIRVIRATGGEARRIVRLYGLRAGAITAAGTALGYAVGVVTTNVVVNAAIYLGVPTSLAIRVTPRTVTILLPLYAATVAVGAIAGVVAAWKVTRDSPVTSASRRRSSNDGANARLRGFLSRVRPLSLLDWRVLLPSVVPLAAFATVVILVASITGVVTPLVHPGGSTVTDPGASNPIASRVPAGYAAAIDRRGTEASPEILALDVHDGHPMVVRGVRFGSFANVSDATLVRGRRPHGPDEAVVGTDLARTLGLSTNDSVTLGGSTTPGLDRVKIVGEYAAPGPYDDQLLVSLPTARHLANVRPGNVQMVRTATRLEGTGTSASNGNASDGIAVVGVSAPAQVRQNASIPIRLQLQNLGSSQASRAVSVRVGDRNRTTTVSLDGGAQREVLVRLPAGRLGTERISVAGQRRTVRVVSGDAIEIRGLPDRAPPNTDPLVRVVDVSGNPVTNATVSGGNGRGGMKTGPNGTVRVHLGDSGPATIRATAGDRSATTTVRVSRSASRLPVGRLQVQPDRPTLLGRPTARLAVSNPWNETISRRVAVVSGSQRFTRNLTLGPGEQRTVTPQLDRRSPGSYAVTAAVDGRTIARTNYRVVGDDRVVSALANSGRSGGTGISRAITTAFGDLNLLIGVFVCLAGLMTVGSTTATVAYTVHSRRQVVGVHRATGASPLRILSLVLLDAITVGTVATILAFVVAVAAVSLLAEAGLLVLYGVRITPLLTPRVAASVVAGGIGVMCLSALLVAFALLRTPPDSLLSGYGATANPNAELGGDSNE
ncbi:FtsX-like permease family protein [Haladaptatus sp. AB643]|uniref:FtsX-like permease family protein n=1 Tax=Haladaptatus sp. AB643 TaxID=2934174 RepID=UPI00209BBDE9|nr:ABC transporter permease [Haladaptatus sp. AB643]